MEVSGAFINVNLILIWCVVCCSPWFISLSMLQPSTHIQLTNANFPNVAFETQDLPYVAGECIHFGAKI